jgi:hypothetical protein
MNDTFKSLATMLGTVAPTLATMLGGPLAGTAVAALEGAFGLQPGGGSDAITKVVQGGGMTPDALAAVRAADQKHAEVLAQQGIDLAKLNADHEAAMAQSDAGDRDSARKREIAVRGTTTPALAWLVVAASVALGAAVVLGAVTKDPAQATLVGTVIGYVFSEAKQVLAYYFGTTADSGRKTELLAQSTPSK